MGKKRRFETAFSVPTVTQTRLLDLPNGTWPAAEVPTGSQRWYLFALSYKEAADRLSESMSDTYSRNMLGAPMLFLYRHYVELHLKSLLLDAGELLDDPQSVPPRHYLQALWTRVRAMLLTIDPGSDGAWFTRADDIVQQLDRLDPTSNVFRYPVGTDGSPSLGTTLFAYPSVVAQVIEELHVLLDGASTQIDVYQGLKYEGY
jgi:hypothetical protein